MALCCKRCEEVMMAENLITIRIAIYFFLMILPKLSSVSYSRFLMFESWVSSLLLHEILAKISDLENKVWTLKHLPPSLLFKNVCTNIFFCKLLFRLTRFWMIHTNEPFTIVLGKKGWKRGAGRLSKEPEHHRKSEKNTRGWPSECALHLQSASWHVSSIPTFFQGEGWPAVAAEDESHVSSADGH